MASDGLSARRRHPGHRTSVLSVSARARTVTDRPGQDFSRRDRERQRAKAARDEAEKEAWERYEEKWAALNPSAESSTSPLTFKSIPWPLLSPPGKVEDITPARIAMFLLSPNHSGEVSRKDRIKNALRRWHPDRFGRILTRVVEIDKKDVEEGVGIIARCLNSLMERETKLIAQTARTHFFFVPVRLTNAVATENH